jgi:hypothetical protein
MICLQTLTAFVKISRDFTLCNTPRQNFFVRTLHGAGRLARQASEMLAGQPQAVAQNTYEEKKKKYILILFILICSNHKNFRRKFLRQFEKLS